MIEPIEILALAVVLWMPFTWFMLTNYALIKDTSQEGMILYGLAPKISPDKLED